MGLRRRASRADLTVDARHPLEMRPVTVTGRCPVHGRVSGTVQCRIARGDSYTVREPMVCITADRDGYRCLHMVDMTGTARF